MLQPLEAILRASLRNRAVVLVITLLFIAVGVRSALKLSLDAVPDVTSIQVQVVTSAPALSPVEVEQYVSVPIERAMAGIPRSTELRSLSKYGMSIVTVVFDEGTDIYFARQLVAERMPQVQEAVPERFGSPQLAPITSGLGEVYQFMVRGEGRSLMELEEVMSWYIGPQLRMVPGVTEVNTLGGESKQYQVVVDPARLQAAGLSVQEVVSALERTNVNAGGGYLERNREQLLIGTSGLVRDLDDLRSVVIGATPQGTPITVAHVGEVRLGPELRRGSSSVNGQGEVVVGVALMLLGENSRTVARAVDAKLKELNGSLPEGVRIEPFYDRSELVDRIIHTVGKNLLEGAGLVIVVLLLLLGNLRAGLIVACTIPLSMLFAMALMEVTGASGNVMSLGAIDFGLIVDSSVIIVENAVRKLAERRRETGLDLTGDERLQIVEAAAIEVRGASVFGEAIIAIVYLPILALRGIEGKLFQPMAKTVLFALAGAFILSLTVVPVLCSLFLVPEAQEHETALAGWTRRGYLSLLDRVFRHRTATIAGGFLLLVLGGVAVSRLGSEFVPQLDEGDILLEIRRLPGVSLDESIRTDRRIQEALLSVPEIRTVVSKTGTPKLATDPMGIEQTDVYITPRPKSEWRRGLTKAALGEELSSVLAQQVPEAAVALSQPIQMRTNELVAGIRSDVAAHVYGPDLDVLQRLAEEVGRIVEQVPGATDVRVEQGSGMSYLRIVPDRARLARYGLTVEDVSVLTQAMSVGAAAGTVLDGDRRFPLAVKLPELEQGNIDVLRALPLKSTTGQMVPLGDVAELSVEPGPSVVNRDRQSRRRTVELNVRGRDLASVVENAREVVARQLSLPKGYRVEWGGQFENLISARRRLAWIAPTALALILFLLWIAFGELKPALLIFLNVPFALIGGAVALWIRGLPLSVSAGVGFIALCGVSVLNGLVLVSFAHPLQRRGLPPTEAIRSAAPLRLRPVLMTAWVAALGFLPMALSTAPGSEVQRPLATVVIGGLFSATALTLLLFPVVYAWVLESRES